MFCQKCGKELPEDAKFCNYCGEQIATIPTLNKTEQNLENSNNISNTPENNTQIEPSKKSKLTIILVAIICILVGAFSALVITINNNNNSINSSYNAEESNNIQEGSNAIIDNEDTGNTIQRTNNALVNRENTGHSISISQVDYSQFPKIRIYFNLLDLNGNLISSIPTLPCNIKENIGSDWQSINSELIAQKTDNSTDKIVSFVMDVSGSMEDENKFYYAKNAVNAILSKMQETNNYQTSFLSFNDQQNLLEDFTKDYTALKNSMNAITPNGATSFYDTLEMALLKINRENGQKYIIALTDGMDNASITTKENVIELSKTLKIPIYIIDLDNSYNDISSSQNIVDIATNSGGQYFTIDDISQLEYIYTNIFNIQKDVYVLEYQTPFTEKTKQWHNFDIQINDEDVFTNTTSSYFMQDYLEENKITNDVIQSVSASSHLEEYYNNTGHLYHLPENAIDGSYRTAWVEDAPGYGIGEWIQLQFDKTYILNGLEISNGYKQSQDLFYKNGKIKDLRVWFSDGDYEDFVLSDSFSAIEVINFSKPKVTKYVKLEILSAYPSTKYEDTCLTEIEVF